MHQGGFVPAEFKKQQVINSPPFTLPTPQSNPKPQSTPQITKRTDGPNGIEQVQSLFHVTTSTEPEEAKQTSSIQCQTEMSLEFVSVCQVPEAPFGLIAEAQLGGKPVRVLVDTGATINLIRSEVYRSLANAPTLKSYKGTLESADGRQVGVEGWVTTNLKLGSIDDEIEALVVPELKADMIVGLRSLKEHECSLDFQCDNLWTGTQEGSIVPLHYETLKVTKHFTGPVTVTSEAPVAVSPLNPSATDSTTPEVGWEPPYGPGDTVEDGAPAHDDHEVQIIMESGPTEFQDQAQRHLDEDVEKILELSAPEVSETERTRLKKLVIEFRDVFALTDAELGQTNLVTHTIDTGDTSPIKIPPHRTSPAKLPIIREEVQSMLKRGVIQPSKSPYSAPIVLQTKKDGSWRFCVDYRKLNDVTVKDAFPIPKIHQTFDALNGQKYFSSLDLASGYWQVPVAEEDRHKTAFVTPDGGFYEYVMMPFGLSNAPATFQRLMNELFREHLWKWALVFLDDVLVYSRTEDAHFLHLKFTFQLLRAANLKLKPKKCRLVQKEVIYLSHIIGSEGIQVDPKKVEVVSNWPVPTTVKGVRSFLGFCNYYRRFVKDFAGIASPLSSLTKKKVPFVWTDQCQAAFERLRRELITAPVLEFPDYTGSFIVDTDASNTSLGAVLSNVIDGDERPLVFASRVLSKTETNYSTTKREALAVVQAVKWFKSYIWGVKFVLRTDHSSLQWLFKQKDPDGMTFRMQQQLQEFEFQVVHRAGNKHGNADGLSRMLEQGPDWLPGEREEAFGPCPELVSLEEALRRVKAPEVETVATLNEEGTDTNEEAMTWERTPSEISRLQKEDDAISQVFYWVELEGDKCDMPSLGTNLIPKEQAIQYGPEALAYWSRWNELSIRDGILYKKWFPKDDLHPILQTVVPASGRKEILVQLHSSQISGGHFAVEKTLSRIRQRFWWPTMRTDVEKKIQWCLTCAARSTGGKKRVAGLVPFKVGIRFSTVAADILGPVTTAAKSRAKHILVMTDLFTKFAVAVPLVSTDSAEVAREIVENWVLKFGAPNVLHTDQGKNFGSNLILEMCRLLGIDKSRTSPYHPQGNGQVERHNRVIADIISKYCADNPKTWDTVLPYLNFVYNTTIHRTTGATPFNLVHGQECQYPIDLFYPKPHDEIPTQDGFVEWLDEQFRDAHSSARELLGTNQRRQKDQYRKRVHGDPYATGDKVWVWAKEKIKSKKFFLPWEGPYVILAKISEVNYKVAKMSNLTKVRYLHFNLLKPYVEEILPADEETPSKRPTPSRSVGFFDDPGITDDEVEMAIGEPSDSRPVRLPTLQLPPRGRMDDEARLDPVPEKREPPAETEAVETYDAVELEARREEEPVPACDPVGADPPEPEETRETNAEHNAGTPERAARRRRPPVRFGIDEFELR